jgi:hypothetical protein
VFDAAGMAQEVDDCKEKLDAFWKHRTLFDEKLAATENVIFACCN